MEIFNWLDQHWFDAVQTFGLLGGLYFTARIMRKDHEAQTMTNTLAINEQYNRIWDKLYELPKLARILEKNVDLNKRPMTNQEERFVKTLILHLDVVRRATDEGIFVKIEGMQKDIQDFFDHPIPKAVWRKIKPFQDTDFVSFIEESLHKK